MKTKLIQTKDYLLLIHEEAEIRVNNLFYPMDGKGHITRRSSMYLNVDGCGKIIAYRKLSEEAKELDLPLLPLVGLETEEGKIWKEDGVFVYLQNGKKYKKSELELWVENT